MTRYTPAPVADHPPPAMVDPYRFHAVYRLCAQASEIEARAHALAVEQSIEMPPLAVRNPRVSREVVGRVERIETDARAPDGREYFHVTLGLALETTGGDAGQLMNMLFGNSSLHDDVELVDFDLAPAAAWGFGGPRHGVAGLRAACGAPVRPLTCSALKPQGSSPEELATLAYRLASAGLDIIKDDHGLADQAAAPFRARVEAVQAAVARANREHGGRTLYAPSVTGAPEQLIAQARFARDAGVGALLVAPMISGMSTLQTLAGLDLPLIAHPALGGATRIAPSLLLGKLFRLAGADATIFPNFGGRFSYSAERCAAIAQAARRPWADLRPCLPVPAGGIQLDRIESLVRFYGPDTMLLIGGALLESDDIHAAARDFVQRVARPVEVTE